VLALAAVAPAGAQAFAPQRAADGHPDFTGVWVADFITRMERPDGFPDLVVAPDKAGELVKKLTRKQQEVYDPDNDFFQPNKVLSVGGELRSSWVVEPRDGKLPYTALAKALMERLDKDEKGAFDNPEDRPTSERCIGALGAPPITAISVVIPNQIVQTANAVVVHTEDVDPGRVIHLSGAAPPVMMRTRAGYSAGRWDGDTLVVTTTHIAATDPSGAIYRDAMVLSEGSRVTERFRLLSNDEMLYQFTIEDPALYEKPWLAEYTFRRHGDRLYEYACHEGNAGLVNILKAARLGRQLPAKKPDDAKTAKPEKTPPK
jgi:hypothetical protein